MTGLLAILLAKFRAALRRRLIAYLLMAAAGLLGLFAAGYGLDAAHAALSHAYGPVVASLIIAGGLLVNAAVCAALALAKQAPARPERPAPRIADPAAYAAPKAAMAALKQRPLAALAAGALSAGAAASFYVMPPVAQIPAGQAPVLAEHASVRRGLIASTRIAFRG